MAWIMTGYLVFQFFILFSVRFVNFSWKQKRIQILFFAITVAILAFILEPPIGWDLSRHFLWMNEIRDSNLSFNNFIFNNINGVGLYEYKNLIFYNLIRYIIIKLTDNNHWLPCICTFFNYIIVGYIAYDWEYTNHKHRKMSLITPFLCSAFLPFILVVSGIRTALASSIAALAIYLYLYKKRRMILFIILMLISSTIHQVVLFSIPFVCLSKLKIGIKGLIFSISFSFIINIVSPYMVNSKYSFLAFLGQKFVASPSFGGRFALLADIILILAFLGLYFILGDYFKKFVWDESHKTLYIFLIYYMGFILGNIGNNELILRPSYLLGFFSPLFAELLENKKAWIYIHGERLQYAGIILCILLCLLASYDNVLPIFNILLIP